MTPSARPLVAVLVDAQRDARAAVDALAERLGTGTVVSTDELPLVVTTSRWTGPVVALLDRFRDRFSTALG